MSFLCDTCNEEILVSSTSQISCSACNSDITTEPIYRIKSDWKEAHDYKKTLGKNYVKTPRKYHRPGYDKWYRQQPYVIAKRKTPEKLAAKRAYDLERNAKKKALGVEK